MLQHNHRECGRVVGRPRLKSSFVAAPQLRGVSELGARVKHTLLRTVIAARSIKAGSSPAPGSVEACTNEASTKKPNWCWPRFPLCWTAAACTRTPTASNRLPAAMVGTAAAAPAWNAAALHASAPPPRLAAATAAARRASATRISASAGGDEPSAERGTHCRGVYPLTRPERAPTPGRAFNHLLRMALSSSGPPSRPLPRDGAAFKAAVVRSVTLDPALRFETTNVAPSRSVLSVSSSGRQTARCARESPCYD